MKISWERLERFQPLLPSLGMMLMLSVFFSVTAEKFLTLKNFLNILDQTAAIAIMAIGLTLVLIGGSFDLSGGSILALVGVICAKLLDQGLPVWLVLLLGLLLGSMMGLFNGLCIARLRLASFIMTLTTTIMADGIALAVSGGRTIYGLPESFNLLGAGRLGPVPVSALMTIVLFLLFHLILSQTVFGHQLYAVGENREFAENAGIHGERVTIIAFWMAGLLYAVAAIALTGRFGAAVSSYDSLDMELTALSGLAIGGISMTGGRGSLAGTFLGCLTIGVLSNGLNLLNLSPYYADFIRGLVIFGTLLLEAIRVMLERRKS